MDKKKILLAVAALLFAGLAAFGVNMLMRDAAAPPVQAAAAPKVEGPMIMVATRPLAVGTIINPEMIRFQPWPKELIESAYFLKSAADIQSLQGSVVRTAMTAGQPVTQGSLVKPGDRGFLAAALGPGMRAVTIPVGTDSGVGGFVFPGDRVDLVLTSSVKSNEESDLKVAETFIRNIRVLATDQRTDSKNAEGKDEIKAYNQVTLEATPQIAEKIAVAQTIGRISLSLRSIADTQAELEKSLAQGEISLPPGTDAKKEREIIMEMTTRPIDRGSTATVGGQVSRYQANRAAGGAVQTAVTKVNQAIVIEKYAKAARQASGLDKKEEEQAKKPSVRVFRGDAEANEEVGGN